jgi:hypothetical protein
MTEDERLARGHRFAAWLEDARTQEVLAAIRDSAIGGIKACRYGDAETVMFYKTLLGIADEFESYARQAINDGKVASAEIEQARLNDRLRREKPYLFT